MTCPRCDAPADVAQRYCTVCGLALEMPEEGAAPRPAPEAPPLVPCPACGASNAGSRERCGRCGAFLGTGETPPDALPALIEEDAAPAPRRETSGMLLLVVVVAGLVTVAVLVAMLSRSGLVFSGLPVGDDTAAAPLEIATVTASSARTGREAHRIADDAPATAWEPADDGVGAWVEVVLAEPAEVASLIVWNGDHAPGAFSNRSRVSVLRIDAGERQFTVALLDLAQPQEVELATPVLASRVRLTVEASTDDGQGVALSEVELYPSPPD